MLHRKAAFATVSGLLSLRSSKGVELGGYLRVGLRRPISRTMGKRKRKADPVVPVIKSRKKARQVVTQFHKLEEALSNLKKTGEKKNKSEERKSIEKAMGKLGGRAVYQAASNLSVSHFNTSKWVLKQLRTMGVKPQQGAPPLHVLEVGAINTFLLDTPWLDVEAIDLKSGHERIRQADFFDLPVQPPRYHVIVSSMVLNSVPDPHRRGIMLQRMSAMLLPAGHLFLMLPLSCLTKSPHIDVEGFEGILRGVGFSIVHQRTTPKVAFFVCRRDGEAEASTQEKKTGSRVEVKKPRKAGSWVKDFDVIL